MPIVLRQDVQLARLISRTERGMLRVKQMTAGLSDDALFWRPPEGGWGIAHFLEDATTTAKPYLRRLPSAIEKGRRRKRFSENGKWKLSLAGGILRWRVGTEAGTGSSPWFRRMPMPAPDVLSRFFATQSEIAKVLRSADGLNLGAIYCWLGGPALWRLSDCCTLVVAHTERALVRAKHVRHHPDFPGPPMHRREFES